MVILASESLEHFLGKVVSLQRRSHVHVNNAVLVARVGYNCGGCVGL